MTEHITHSELASVQVNGIEIAYDTFGESAAPALLLIRGWKSQMIAWNVEFCKQFAARGYKVIRFDNRDAGLSTKFDDVDMPDVSAVVQALERGETISAPYTLRDMAQDAVGLLDALKIESAHMLGVSMGAAIAQELAIHHPDRVLTLISVMSSTGDPDLSINLDAGSFLIEPTPTDREGYLKRYLEIARMLNGPQLPFDEDFVRELALQNFDRGLCPAGGVRQLAAIVASGSRKEALKSVNIPSLVIHGGCDPLVPVECGVDTANTIPGADLLILEDMGHALSPSIWPQFQDAVASFAR